MAEYTEGICGDGAAILKDGVSLSVSEVLNELRVADAWITFTAECFPDITPIVSESPTTGQISIHVVTI